MKEIPIIDHMSIEELETEAETETKDEICESSTYESTTTTTIDNSLTSK